MTILSHKNVRLKKWINQHKSLVTMWHICGMGLMGFDWEGSEKIKTLQGQDVLRFFQ